MLTHTLQHTIQHTHTHTQTHTHTHTHTHVHTYRLQEWETPAPSRRPDIFPEFEKMERVFLPKPLPGDPEMPDEEAEEAKKRTVRVCMCCARKYVFVHFG